MFKMKAGVPEAEWRKRAVAPLGGIKLSQGVAKAANDNNPEYVPGNYRVQPEDPFQRFRMLRGRR
jgi:hypothetical protein